MKERWISGSGGLTLWRGKQKTGRKNPWPGD
jgi:hypothetical protein